jgi:hypothetical protein
LVLFFKKERLSFRAGGAEKMSMPKTPGRVAGALYLLSAIAAGVRLIYVPAILTVDGNAAATSHTKSRKE